jgi:endo-1,4-beta-xylanase
VSYRRSMVIGSIGAIVAIGVTTVLLGQFGVFGATSTTATDPSPTPGGRSEPSETLRSLGSPAGLRIGTAINTEELAGNAEYRAIAADQFSTVTAENVMKWEVVEPARGSLNWEAADQLVAFAQENDQLVRGHTLVWHSQLPPWLKLAAPSMAPDELRELLHKHVTDQVTHFKGKIWQWDVVNEAFKDDGTLRDDIWLQKLGPGYIADAFRWAHEADPEAQLFYNDYSIEFTGVKSNATYALVKDLLAQGVPIDGVGFQTHLATQYGLPDLQHNLERFSDLGLNVAETEVDVRTSVPVTPEGHSAQLAGYTASLEACLAVRRCISYTLWGFGDAYSWVPGFFPGTGSANIYDDALKPKDEYFTVYDTLASAVGGPDRSAAGLP